MSKINFKEKSRTTYSLFNIIFGIINFLVKTIMVFIVRRVFIKTLGLEYLGLNSLFANIITVLSIAEIGIGTAVSQTLYNCYVVNDKEKIGAILGYYKKVNNIIAVIVTAIGCLLIPFLKYFINQEIQINISLELIYILTLANVVVSYFFSYRKVIFQTCQRIDVLYNITSVYYIALYIAQIIILYFTRNYLIYLLSNIFITLLENVTVQIFSKKHFADFVCFENQKIDLDTRKNIRGNVASLFYQKIGNTIIFGTDNILISLLIANGIIVLGKYSNYVLITSALITVLHQILNSITASIGNSLVEKDVEYNFKLFNKLNFIYLVLVGFCTIGFITLADNFISILFGENLELNTIDVVLLGISFYLTESRYLVKTYKEAKGIIQQFKFCYIIQAIINLIVSILLGKIIGLTGIILGTIISTIAMPLWSEFYLTNKYYFKKSTLKYFLKYSYYALVTLIAGGATWYINSLISCTSFYSLILKFIVFVPVAVLSYCLFLFNTKEFKETISWVKSIFKSKRKKEI